VDLPIYYKSLEKHVVMGVTAYKWRSHMKYNTVYVGMDVHKETFSVCCYTNEKEKAE